jgi:hypothetical protein
VVIKRNGRYFLITSGLTGWNFNRAKYFRATNLFGPYTDLGDPSVGLLTETTFNSQGTHAFPIEEKPGAFILITERHNTARMTDSSFIFLPVHFPTPDTLELRYIPEWKWESWSD